MLANIQLELCYVVSFPNGEKWAYDQLGNTEPAQRSWWSSTTKIAIPVDLVTAVNLGMLRQGQNPPLSEAFWAWAKLTDMVKTV